MNNEQIPPMGLTTMFFDPLYCQEDHYWDGDDNAIANTVSPEQHLPLSPLPSPEEEWVEVLSTLYSNELEIPDGYAGSGGAALYLHSARRGAVEWVARACAVHGFSAVTALLAVSYLDRCFVSEGLRMQPDLPWMGRLSAVACLSLAAKVDETHVPLLLDLQAAAADSGAAGEYAFEAKTVRRMELLVLSTLGWRMNPVTPLTFIDHLLPKVLDSAASGGGARLPNVVKSCEAILLSVVGDWRWVLYPPSIWAAAALLHAFEDENGDWSEYGETNHVLALLNLTKEGVEGCYQLISEALGANNCGNKRKQNPSHYCHTSPPSPSGVLSSCFSYDSSCDSWAATWPSSVSSSPDPQRPCKRLNCGNADNED